MTWVGEWSFWNSIIRRSLSHSRLNVSWNISFEGDFNFNVDEFARGKSNLTGCEGVLKDSNYAELMVIENALQLFASSFFIDLKQLIVKSDSNVTLNQVCIM